MKKLCCALLLAAALRCGAGAVSAKAAAVIDADTGQTLFAHNADARLPMASTTKIMTALVALGEGGLDRTFTVKKAYTRVEGSSMYLREGETISLRDVLYGLMLESGNDAAVAIAGECGGQQAFVRKMNEKAAALGLKDTHFDNPNGLDGETHYTTARELARLTAAALQDPVFRRMAATVEYKAGGRVMRNHNRLLQQYEGAIGVKTGFTRRSGRCLVSAAVRHGRTLIAVTLNDADDWNDHRTLLDDAFARYAPAVLHRQGEQLAVQRVFGGDADEVPLLARNTVTAYLLPGEQEKLARVRYGERICYAPVVQSANAGRVEYRLGSAVLAGGGLCYGGGSVLAPEQKSLPERLLERFLTE